jgi:hypothetical protein
MGGFHTEDKDSLGNSFQAAAAKSQLADPASFRFFLARFSSPVLTLAVPLALPNVGLAWRNVSWSKLFKA